MLECCRHAGVDLALLCGTAGLCRKHVDLDLAMVGRKPMLDTRNDGPCGLRLAEMARPDLGERGIILGVGEINLRMQHIFQPRTGQFQRRRNALGDEKFRLELDRLAAPLHALRHQRRRGDAVALRLIASRHAGDAGDKNEISDSERRRVAGRRARSQSLMLEVHNLESSFRDDRHRLNVHVCIRQQQPLLCDRGRGRDTPLQEFPPDMLIGRHRVHRRVVLVGANQIGSVGAGRAQHSIEVCK